MGGKCWEERVKKFVRRKWGVKKEDKSDRSKTQIEKKKYNSRNSFPQYISRNKHIYHNFLFHACALLHIYIFKIIFKIMKLRQN